MVAIQSAQSSQLPGSRKVTMSGDDDQDRAPGWDGIDKRPADSAATSKVSES